MDNVSIPPIVGELIEVPPQLSDTKERLQRAVHCDASIAKLAAQIKGAVL
jgi:hypothetical protein